VRHLKTAGPLPFLWDRWELAPASAPRLGLDQLLEANIRGATLMLDLKGRHLTAARNVARLLEGRAPSGPVLVCGRWWPAVEAVAELSGVRPVLSARNRGELARLRRRLQTGAPVHGVSVHRSLLTAALVAELQARVEVVMTWPVNDLATLDTMLAMGVTGVISDDRAVLGELLGRRREPA
jgi:glycerophosphoryl diester phosphodiesterase